MSWVKPFLIFVLVVSNTSGFQPHSTSSSASIFSSHSFVHGRPRCAIYPLHLSSGSDSADLPSTSVTELKNLLLTKISEFRDLKSRDGDLSIDFGVKGGELNATSRAPQKVDFYAISKRVGDKAGEIIQVCDQLATCSTYKHATAFLGDRLYGKQAPLHGTWKSLFTTAADANFSKNSTRGAAKVQNIVDGKNGRITNVIDFETKDDGSEPVLKQLNVVIKAIPVGPKRVELQFRYAKAVFTRFLLWKVRWSLYIPVPGPFITRCIVFLSRIIRLGKVKKVPKGYFDVLFLDKDLRVHRTGEDNLFVQVRDTWEAAKSLLV